MKKIFFLGQAPARPTSKHDIPGTYLHAWLHSIGFSDEIIKGYCSFYALTDNFPGATKNGHLAPTKQQISTHRPLLQKALFEIQPDIVVPVGKMAIAELLQAPYSLEETIGHTFHINPLGALPGEILCIPFSHPSGRNAWNHTHKDSVRRALQQLKDSSLLDA